ncbi:hypothetical protein [uncultured Hymenobacter sp.]|uniref:hypothetical protein n=1 Tax=uncultured Hymenobacter sp. TaxID=170016 RepID=UPI0035C9C239
MDAIRSAVEQLLQSTIANDITEDEALAAAQGEERAACPVCLSVAIRERKTMSPRFLCSKIHGFEQPTQVVYYPHVRSTDKNLAVDAAKDFLAARNVQVHVKRWYDEMSRQALLETLRQSIAFIEGKPYRHLCADCLWQAADAPLTQETLDLVIGWCSSAQLTAR